jgi:acetylornithine deacetylase/succinyl-diaminopimelate desuccinylase-like protein
MKRCAGVVFWVLLMVQVSQSDKSFTTAANAAAPAQETARLASLPEVHTAWAWFAAHERELAALQMELAAIPSPPFGEGQRAAWFAERLRELGLEQVHIDEAGNVLGIRAGTVEGAKYVALTAHLDTVFPAGTPMNIRRDGTRLLGPGIADNAAGLTALLAMASVLQAAHIRHCAPVLFVADVGEEGEGDLRGIRHLFRDARWREAIAYTVVLDGGGTDTIITEGLGSRRFEATVRGPGGHSWTDFGTPNPIVILAQAIDLFARSPVPQEPKTTFNIGVIEGGTSVNTIPETASMKVDMRSASAAELDRLEKSLRESLARATGDLRAAGGEGRRMGSVSYELKIIGERPAADLPPDARILEVMRAVDAHLRIASRSQRASTDANIPLSLGHEAVAIGAGGSGGGAHTLHEWYDPANREIGLRRILLALLALTGVQ